MQKLDMENPNVASIIPPRRGAFWELDGVFYDCHGLPMRKDRNGDPIRGSGRMPRPKATIAKTSEDVATDTVTIDPKADVPAMTPTMLADRLANGEIGYRDAQKAAKDFLNKFVRGKDKLIEVMKPYGKNFTAVAESDYEPFVADIMQAMDA